MTAGLKFDMESPITKLMFTAFFNLESIWKAQQRNETEAKDIYDLCNAYPAARSALEQAHLLCRTRPVPYGASFVWKSMMVRYPKPESMPNKQWNELSQDQKRDLYERFKGSPVKEMPLMVLPSPDAKEKVELRPGARENRFMRKTHEAVKDKILDETEWGRERVWLDEDDLVRYPFPDDVVREVVPVDSEGFRAWEAANLIASM